MHKVYKNFIKSTYRLRKKAESINVIPPNHQDWRFGYVSTTLISEIWQAWCKFCYNVIEKSCSGTTLRNGIIVPRRALDNSWGRIAYEVKEYGLSRVPRPAGKILYKYQEPTWGDVDKLLRAIPNMHLANSAKLISALGIAAIAPSHLQITRNACYHLNPETMQKVRSIQPHYRGVVRQYPYELLWCKENNTNADAVYFWIDELETIAALST
jgi:hypothetical protein